MTKVTGQTFEERMKIFNTELKIALVKHYADCLKLMPNVDFEPGSKFVRVVKADPWEGGQRSVWGFVEITTGDIYKAAGWNARAKHVRGSIYNENPLMGCNAHGPNYIVR